MDKTCKNCRFYRLQNGSQLPGECYRYPPVWVTCHPFTNVRLPIVVPDNWCGEWHGTETPKCPKCNSRTVKVFDRFRHYDEEYRCDICHLNFNAKEEPVI